MKKVSGNHVIYKFQHNMDYVERVSSGEIIKVETNDCFFQQIIQENQLVSEIDFDRVNPATGPIYIEDAQPGDLLKVKILDIIIAEKGVGVVVQGGGILGDKATNSATRIFPIVDNHAVLNNIKLPIDPMIGVIGVAPGKDDGEWPTASPWKHGGNMDTTDIRAGAVLYLPVRQEGALLALGDCHAVMGDGEVSMAGLEIPANVVIQVEVIKNKMATWPLVETKDFTMVIASGDGIDEAIYAATDQAVQYIKSALEVSWEDAYILSSLSVDLKISQLVNDKKTVRAAIPKHLVSTKTIIDSL